MMTGRYLLAALLCGGAMALAGAALTKVVPAEYEYVGLLRLATVWRFDATPDPTKRNVVVPAPEAALFLEFELGRQGPSGSGASYLKSARPSPIGETVLTLVGRGSSVDEARQQIDRAVELLRRQYGPIQETWRARVRLAISQAESRERRGLLTSALAFGDTEDFRILSAKAKSSAPVFPRVRTFSTIGFLAGLLLVLLVFIWREVDLLGRCSQ